MWKVMISRLEEDDMEDPADALEALQIARRRMAGRARWSFGRHLAVGLVMGVLVASYALPGALQMFGLAVCLIAVGVIIARDRRRDGFFVNGYRTGRTRPFTFLLLGCVLAIVALAVAARIALGWAWAPLAAGLAIVPLVTWGSLHWERIYRRELEGESQ
jgi:hypothetical protein